MKRRSIVVLVGVCMAALVLAPSLALAADQVFTYDKGPKFTVTYPGSWAEDSANPNNALIRVKDPSGIPIMEVHLLDIRAGVDLAVVGSKAYKPRLEENYDMTSTLTSEKQIKLSDGTPANEATLEWLYQGWLPLQTHVVSAYKDNKWVYVSVSGDPGPLTKVPTSLTFK